MYQHEGCIITFICYCVDFSGYDLKQVNMYINKLFENVGSLVYEEVDDTDKYQFQVTGVCSILGEKLPFSDVS